MFSLSNEDDDGTFGGPVGGGSSKLASLFGHDKASFTGGNESLKYTAPKQPKKDKQAGQGDAPAVAASAAIHAYKFIDNQYVNQGKLGAALLANHSASDYKILLYAGKQQHVAVARIHSQFAFTVQANNYASFCDDQRQRWSVCFDSEKNAVLFAKQVGLAIFNMQPSSLFTQDLKVGDEKAIETGDAVECKYTGWLWTNNTFGKVFDSNAELDKTFKFKTGRGKVIKGWDQGVIGMKKGGKRFIGIPPSLAYGEKGVGGGRVPPNASLLFEVEVLRIKSKDGGDSGGSKSSSRTESPVTMTELQAAPLPNITNEPSGVQKKRSESSGSIKGRTASLNEQLSQSPDKNTDKARLLARMSKMGKNVLTVPGAAVADDDDDDEEETNVTEETTPEEETTPHEIPASPTQKQEPIHHEHVHSNPRPNPRPKPHVPQRPAPVQPHPEVQHNPTTNPIGHQQGYNNPPAQQLALYQNPQAMPMNYPIMQPPQYYQQTPFPAQAFPQPQPPPPPQAPAPAQPSANDAMVPVLMAETRQQQSEVRMAISKVTEKVDEVLHKVERLQHGSGALVPAENVNRPSANSETMMEASVLLHNISRIVQENEKLRKDNNEKTIKIEVLNEKISDLLHKNQKFLEKSNVMMEQSSDSLQHTSAQSQARVLALEQEKISQSAELTELKTRMAETDAQLSSLRKQETELKSQLNKALSSTNKYKEELEHIKELHEEKESLSTKLKQDLKEEKQTRKRLESRSDHMEEELSDLRHEKESLEKSISERKKKQNQDRRKFEEELEELKNQQEDEIKTLKERHRRDKKSGDASAEQIAQVEFDIEARWTDKAAKMVAQNEQKWKRKHDDLMEEKEELSKKLTSLEEKYSGLKSMDDEKEEQLKHLQTRIDDLNSQQEKATSSKDEKDKEIQQLKAAIEDLKVFESKYQDTRARAMKMKEEYERQISTAEEEHELAVTVSYKKGLEEGKRQGGSKSTLGSEAMANEVKKIMNNVFYMLRSEFDASTSYTGKDIMSVVLKVVKEVTLKQVSTRTDEGVDEEDDTEEEEEDDDEEDEEQEEEVEKEDEEEEEDKEKEDKEEEEEEKEKEDKEEEEEEKEDKEEEEEEKEDKEEEEKGEDKKVGHDEEDKSEDERIEKQERGSSAVKDQPLMSDSSEQSQEENENPLEIPSEEIPSEEIPSEEIPSEEIPVLETVPDNEADGVEKSLEINEHEKDTEEIEKQEESSSSEETISEKPLEEEKTNVSDSTQHTGTIEEKQEHNKNEMKEENIQQDTSKTDFSDESESENEGPPPLDVGSPTTEPFVYQETSAEEKTATKENEKDKSVHKSLFGDDDHDDVAATFGSSTKKPDLTDESSPKPVPPPLFDDDDDDDIDWFK